MKHLRKGNIAFWRYDQPGKRFLAGRIKKVSGKKYPGPGHAVIEGYGFGLWFKPTFCLPRKQGMEAQEAMYEAENKHSRAVDKATADYVHAIRQLVPKGIKI